MQIKSVTKLLTVVILFMLVSACKKENPSNLNTQLIGSWTETPLEYQYNRVFYFGEDGSFTAHSTSFGASPSGSTLNGTYSINGNQLNITITEEISRQQGFPPQNVKVNHPLLDRATFSIVENKLTVNYFSSPLDVPVAAKMVLIKN